MPPLVLAARSLGVTAVREFTEKTDKIHVKKQIVTFVVVSKGRESRPGLVDEFF